MKFIKIGKEYLNLSALVRIKTKEVKIAGKTEGRAKLEFADGTSVYLSEGDWQKIIGTDEIPEFVPADMPSGVFSD